MDKILSGKIAFVTGASRGIGRAIAVRLGGQGATVFLAARDEKMLCETADAVEMAGGKGRVVKLELTSEDSIKSAVKCLEKAAGGLDILVNNAGVTHSGSLGETATEDWDRCFAVNARGAFILCRETLGLLKRAEKGFIINIASVVAVKGYANQSAYTASKHALRGMSMSLAEELRGTNVRVHVICPGAVDTEMVAQVRPDIDKNELIGAGEIAELVTYLVTHKGNAVIDELHVRRAGSGPWYVC